MSAPWSDRNHYAKVYSRIWKDEKFRALPGDARFLFLRLLSGYGCRLTNAATVTAPTLVGDLDFDGGVTNGLANGSANDWRTNYSTRVAHGIERLATAVDAVAAQGMAEFDLDAGIVWIPNGFRHNPPANPNTAKSWIGFLEQLPESPVTRKVVAQFWSHLRERGGKFKALVPATVAGTVPATKIQDPRSNKQDPRSSPTPCETQSARPPAPAREASGSKVSNPAPDRPTKPGERPPPDLSGPSGRWAHFERAWCDRFGGKGMGGFDGRRAQQVDAFKHLSAEEWTLEVDAFLAHCAELDPKRFFPDRPWDYLKKHLGQWAAKAQRKATAERQASGRRVLDDEIQREKDGDAPTITLTEEDQAELAELRAKAEAWKAGRA